MLKSRIYYAILLICLFLFYIFYTDYLSFAALIFFILLPGALYIPVYITGKKIAVSFTADKTSVEKGKPIPFQLDITNSSRIPFSRIKLVISYQNTLSGKIHTETIFTAINANCTDSIQWSVRSQYCGKLLLELKTMTLYDYLGLFSISKELSEKAELLILPKIHILNICFKQIPSVPADSDTFSKTKSGSDSSETFAVREYAEGDSLRSIHWKLSSKTDKLMVREFSLPVSDSILLLLEFSHKSATPQRTMDTIVETAISLSHFFTKNQTAHTVMWHDGQSGLLCHAFVSGQDEFVLLLHQLLNIRPYSSPCVIKQYCMQNQKKQYSHIFYITPVIEREVISLLPDQNNTILYTGEIPLKAISTKRNTTVVTVAPGKICESIGALVISQ